MIEEIDVIIGNRVKMSITWFNFGIVWDNFDISPSATIFIFYFFVFSS